MNDYHFISSEDGRERGYYINLVRFPREVYRRSVELELSISNCALEFTYAQKKQDEYIRSGVKKILDNKAPYPVDAQAMAMYRQIYTEISSDIREYDVSIVALKNRIEELKEKLDD